MKKKTIGIIAFVISIFLVLVLVLQFMGVIPFPSFLKSYSDMTSQSVQIINDYNVKVNVFGDDFSVPNGLEVTKLSELDSSAIVKNGEANKTFLILNDLSGSLNLSENDIEMVRSMIYENHINILYFGEKYINEWDNESDAFSLELDGAKGASFFYISGSVVRGTGFWTTTEEEIYKENSSLFGTIICQQIEDYIRRAF